MMLQRVTGDPVVPIKWGQEQSGMQTGDEIPEPLRPLAEAIWRATLAAAAYRAERLHRIEDTAFEAMCGRLPWPPGIGAEQVEAIEAWLKGNDLTHEPVRVHKSICNRVIEPWMHMTAIYTATEWKNFFRLRCHEDAEVHFQKAAREIRDAIEASTPQLLEPGQWHLPFVTGYDEASLRSELYHDNQIYDTLCKISTARCARTSYMTHDGRRDWRKDLELFARLTQGSGFGHWSPMGHVAQAVDDPSYRSGPFTGWKQYRKLFPMENVEG